MPDPLSAVRDDAIDREQVDLYMERLRQIEWNTTGRVAVLVETPVPHRHVQRSEVTVVKGKGFAGDHDEKSYYKGEYVPGREVTAISLEVLDVLGVNPVVVGDNLITEGLDLAELTAGDRIEIGDVTLERSAKPHRPCRTFRARSSPEAFAVVSRNGYRGALFVVCDGGTIRVGDSIRIAKK